MNDATHSCPEALTKLLQTLHLLRGPEGCPWDREQSPASLRSALLEECWELIAAIDQQHPQQIEEEVGDALLVLLLTVLSGGYSLARILSQLQQKLVHRHPHVFGQAKAETAEQALQSWHSAKQADQKGSLLDSIPSSLPPLERAYKMQRRAARVGFDWQHPTRIVDQIKEELAEWQASDSKAEEQEELGDLLFSLINLIRFQGFDPSLVLQQCNNKFHQRFSLVEQGLTQQGRPLVPHPDQETRQMMEDLWQQAKIRRKK